MRHPRSEHSIARYSLLPTVVSHSLLTLVCLLLVTWSVMIAQWENQCVSLSALPVIRVQFPTVAEHFKMFSPWLITFCQLTRPEPARQKRAQSLFNDTTQPVEIEEEGRSPIMDRHSVHSRAHDQDF